MGRAFGFSCPISRGWQPKKGTGKRDQNVHSSCCLQEGAFVSVPNGQTFPKLSNLSCAKHLSIIQCWQMLAMHIWMCKSDAGLGDAGGAPEEGG